MDRKQHLEDCDKRFVWHPFTQMKEWTGERPIVIERGEGCYLFDTEGGRYLDGVSSLWVNIHGHRKKEIDEAIKEQIDKISHSTLLGLSNLPSIRLAEKLVKLVRSWELGERGKEKTSPDLTPHLTPESFNASRLTSHPFDALPLTPYSSLSKVFYSDNGSTSVEVALKMAFQYWRQKGVEGRNCFLSLNNAYHGDTLGAVSVGGIDIFHAAFAPLLFRTFKSPSPYCYRCELGLEYPGCASVQPPPLYPLHPGEGESFLVRGDTPLHPSPLRREGEGGGDALQKCSFPCLRKMEEILKAHHDEIAAMIIEPLVQAAGGMIVFPPGYLTGARDLCRKYNVLFIADEVATGFGRTGRMFACEHECVVPDIICLSKGITGGYLPLAVTIATDEVYDAFLGDFRELKTFFHGHSYTGNPLGCAAALACLDIFEKERTVEKLGPKIDLLEERLKGLSASAHVGDARNKGLMAGIELVRNKETKEPYAWEEKMGWRVCYRLREKGILLRPLGNVIVIMPPLSISEEELGVMLDEVEKAIKESCG
jgi:adenosylmethionine-8-amino-7-oxononanoate aminotransferase